MLDHRGLRWNGRLSYSFYLWHYIVLTIIVHELYLSFVPPVMKDYAWAMFLGTEVAGIALALALAQLTYRYIEEPGIVLGKRLEAFLHRSLLPRAVPQPGD
jgi:peptidoglycan/LPS O-acetylase OafA/YrhL